MTKSEEFQNFLSTLYKSLGEAAEDIRYSKLFDNDRVLRGKFYSLFDISGATFVVADNRDRRFVLLQDGVEEAKSYKVRLGMPIIQRPDAKLTCLKGVKWARPTTYSRFCNHIFQVERGEQGLGEYREYLSLIRPPDFLAALPSRLEDARTSNQGKDWIYCPAIEIEKLVTAWRWLTWLIGKYGIEKQMSKITIAEAWSAPWEDAKQDTLIFWDANFFRSYKLQKLDLPEWAIARLDDKTSWSNLEGQNILFKYWRRLRSVLDKKEKIASFTSEYRRIKSIFGKAIASTTSDADEMAKTTIEERHSWLAKEYGTNKNATLKDVLISLHTYAPIPIPGYYYFTQIDGRPKEHFVVPVMRSESYPITYYDKNLDIKEHTAVVTCLASLNVQQEQSEDAEARLLRLKTVFRILADRVIDGIFINRLFEAECDSSLDQLKKLLLVSSPEGMPRVYVIGSFERRITFLSQQSRALMLVRALCEVGVLDEKSKKQKVKDTPTPEPTQYSGSIGVIGGGLAGITVAVAAAAAGCDVTLYEEAKEVLHLQREASHRYIHPHIADWPGSGSTDDNAGLPLLNWNAANAKAVIKEVRKKFKAAVKDFRRTLHLKTGQQIQAIEQQNSGKWEVKWSNGASDVLHDVLIIAVGFGKDLPDGVHGHSSSRHYWEVDELEKAAAKRIKILISGSGDGALIDLVRASLKCLAHGNGATQGTLEHHAAIRLLMSKTEFNEIGHLLKDVDRKAQRDRLRGYEPKNLFPRYIEAFRHWANKKTRDKLLLDIKKERRKNVEVIFHYRNSGVVRLGTTAIAHRVLCLLLIEAGIVKTVCGEIIKIDGNTVHFDSNPPMPPTEFDVICQRYGPNPKNVISKITSLKDIENQLGGRIAELETARTIDQTTFKWYRKLVQGHPTIQ